MDKKGSFWLTLVVISGIIYYGGVYYKLKKRRRADDTAFIGKVVTVPANAKIGKLQNFGGEMDDYHYLLPDETEIFKDKDRLYDVVDITKPTQFKVVDEEYSSNHLQCIFEDDSGLTFGAECEDIRHLNVIDNFFQKYNQNLQKNGYVLVGRKAFQTMVKHDFEVNNVYVAKVSTDEELMNFLFADDREIITTLSRLNDHKLFVIDELKESDLHKWNLMGEAFFTDTPSAENIFKINTLDFGLLSTIQKLEPNSLNNRWIFSEMLVLHKKSLYNDSIFNCLKKKYEGPMTKFDEHFDTLKKEALEFGFSFVNLNNDHTFNCENLKRPFVQGGLAIKEGLI